MTGDATAAAPVRSIPQTVWLVAIGITGLVLAAICSLTAHAITSRTWDEIGDAERVAAWTAWADVSVTLGIVALVGATVLTGVARIVSRTYKESAHDPSAAGTE